MDTINTTPTVEKADSDVSSLFTSESQILDENNREYSSHFIEQFSHSTLGVDPSNSGTESVCIHCENWWAPSQPTSCCAQSPIRSSLERIEYLESSTQLFINSHVLQLEGEILAMQARVQRLYQKFNKLEAAPTRRRMATSARMRTRWYITAYDKECFCRVLLSSVWKDLESDIFSCYFTILYLYCFITFFS